MHSELPPVWRLGAPPGDTVSAELVGLPDTPEQVGTISVDDSSCIVIMPDGTVSTFYSPQMVRHGARKGSSEEEESTAVEAVAAHFRAVLESGTVRGGRFAP